MDLCRRLIIQRLMKACMIVKLDIPANSMLPLPYTVIVMQIHFLIFDCSPQSLCENVIEDPSTAIHANPDLMGLQQIGERHTRKLAALITVENLRDSLTERMFQCLKAELYILSR